MLFRSFIGVHLLVGGTKDVNLVKRGLLTNRLIHDRVILV